MIGAEILVLVALLFGGAMGFKSVFSWAGRKAERDNDAAKMTVQMHLDLVEAVKSHDHMKLDDFILLWGDKVEKATLDAIKQRRDDIYIESDKT